MHTSQLRFFGPGVGVGPNQQVVALRSRKQLALLAYLAVEHGISHSRESLLALFWPEETTAVAQNNLRVTLSRLRAWTTKLMPPAASAAEVLIVERNTVQLHPAWVTRIDVNLFTQLLEKSRQHNHVARSHCAHCQITLLAAVQFYRNDFLAGFALDDCPGVEEWLFLQRERLHLLVLDAYSDLATYAEANGDWAAARGFTQRQLEIDPLREAAYRQQMRILVRQGERSLALATFQRCRTILYNELGLDPEPETQALHRQLLNVGEADASQPAGRSADAGGLTNFNGEAAPARPQLPQPLTTFIGRETELTQLQQHLQTRSARLLTLIGPGGIGKTRLALQVAQENRQRFAHGACFVPLAGVQNIEAIPAAIMDALGVRFVEGATAPAEQLYAALAQRQMLLVIDNLEHLMESVPLLLAILQAAPGVTLLVTSREQLNCQAEDLFVLPGLATPLLEEELHQASQYAAVRLFCDRAHRLNKEFRLDAANLRDVVQICRLVAGMPLALELATTWLRDFDSAALAAALAANQVILATTQHDLPARHQSMQAVFLHSWALLTANEQQILSQLACCPGPFALQSAIAMTGASLLDLTRLRYKSLLRSPASGLYEFHPLIRGFALAMLAEPAQQNAFARQAAVYVQLVADQNSAIFGATPQAAFEVIVRELDNIHQAWQWAQQQERADLLLQAVAGLGEYYVATGHSAEGEARFLATYRLLSAQQALAAPDQDGLLPLHLLNELLRCLLWQSKLADVPSWAQRLITVAQLTVHSEFAARGLHHWGYMLFLLGDHDSARHKLAEAVALARQIDESRLVGQILYNLGITHSALGDLDRAEKDLQEGLQIQRSLHNRADEQRLLLSLANRRLEDSDYQDGRRYLTEAMTLLPLTGNRPLEARIVNGLGYAEAMLGNYAAALEHHATARRICQEIQQPETESYALHNLCNVHRKMGDWALAESYGSEALRLALAYDLTNAANYARLHLGYLWLSAGDLAEAAITFQLLCNHWQIQGQGHKAQEALIGMAATLYRQGDLTGAAALIAPLVPQLITAALKGVDEPFEMYLTCYQILSAQGDTQAGALLAAAHARLQALADKITDKALRHSFWHAVPAHRQLHAYWQQATSVPNLPTPPSERQTSVNLDRPTPAF